MFVGILSGIHGDKHSVRYFFKVPNVKIGRRGMEGRLHVL